MNFRKKLLAVLLCIVMTITVIPSGSVSAEEIIDGHAGEEYLETDAENLQEDSTAEAETEDTAIEDTDNETAEEDSDSMDIPTENAKSDIPLTPVSEFGIDADDDSDTDLNDDSEISPANESDYDSAGDSIINPTDTIQESEESDQILADIEDESPYFAVLAFTSDVHNTATNASAERLGNWIDNVIGMYGRIDFMGFCGDLGEDDATEENYWAYTKVVIDLVAEKGVEACYTTGNHEFRPGQFTTTANPVKNYYIKDTEGKEGDYYRIYCLGTDNWNNSSDNYTNAQIQTLNNYLNSVGNDKPIIILAHYPLHSLSSGGAGWNYGGRQTTNAEQLINMLNQAATNGTTETWDDKTIVFLWGHNHSMSDPHYDEIYAPGTSITYTNSGKSKDISFYYAAAGCMSDGDYSQGSGYVKGKGLVITVDSNIQPGFAYYDANGTNVTEGINYPPEPVHVSQVTLDKSEAQVEVGRTIRLNASVTPEDATDKSVYFSSSDVSVATVSNTGTIKGISEGTAIITVTTADGGHTAACVVTVIPRASDTTGYIITIDGYALSMEVSGDELVNTSGSNQNQKFRYHGLTGIPYTAGDSAGDEIIWLLTESEDGTGYYIQSRDGRYLNATYLTNETNGKDGNLLLDDTPDVWTLDGTLDDWMVSGSLLKSTNSGKSLTHEEESQGKAINLFTIRTTGENSSLHVPAEESVKPVFKLHSVTLSGQIGVNFYLELPELKGVDWNESYMVFTVNGISSTAAFNSEFKNSSGKYYGFTCSINSVQMAEPITAEYHYGNEQVVTESYSISQYLDAFDENKTKLNAYMVAVVESMADYGHYIQPFLSAENGWTIGDQYAEMTHYYTTAEYNIAEVKEAVSGYAAVRENKSTDIEKINYSLVLDSETSIRVFFTPAAGFKGTVTATVDGKPAAIEQQSDGRYMVRIPNISAHKLGTTYTVVVTTEGGTATAKLSAMSYVKEMMDAYTGKPAYLKAAASLYYYYHAAYEYKMYESSK